MKNEVLLTEYSHGGGCGCKISPTDLEVLLQGSSSPEPAASLLVGNASRDDAAVIDVGDGKAVISTTDFFMPIVDDPFDFGRVAATNAISDVFAMGGQPVMAIAVFAWPLDKLPLEVGRQVIEGGREVCSAAGAPLAGGHSIDAPEPIFGLSVTGIADAEHIKRNNTARPGDKIYLTKPLGVGVLTTAQKMKRLSAEHADIAVESMCTLNRIGAQLGPLEAVTSMTDVTGFGLAGHLLEMCEGSEVNALIDYDKLPILPQAMQYLELGCSPGGTGRNIASAGSRLGSMSDLQKKIMCDPQTSGGLLITVSEEGEGEFRQVIEASGLRLEPIGRIVERSSGPHIQLS